MIGAVSNGHNTFENVRRSKFLIWNEKIGIQVLITCAIPLPLSLGQWRYKENLATPEQKAFCVLQFAKNESVVSLQQASRQQFQGDSPSSKSIKRWYQQFQTKGFLCNGKSACVRRKCRTSETVFSSQSEEICALCESWTGDVDYDYVEGVAKETGNEALSSSLGAVSSIIWVHDIYSQSCLNFHLDLLFNWITNLKIASYFQCYMKCAMTMTLTVRYDSLHTS
jgi:hypothetical protein